MNVISTNWVTLSDVAVIFAVPGVVPAIKEAVTTPVASGVVTVMVVVLLLKVPKVVVKVRAVPFATALPAASFNVAVIALELESSAGMLVGEAAKSIDPTPPLSRVMVTVPDTLFSDMARITTLPAVAPAV